jgi:hypothetical protein
MRLKIDNNVDSLSYFNSLIRTSERIKLVGELDIEPFKDFDSDFGCIYWYLKYHLLKDSEIELLKEDIKNDCIDFFTKENLNIITIHIVDLENYEIECIDGRFYINIYDDTLLPILEKL